MVGIGGIFFKSGDSVRLTAWYEKHLGLPRAEGGAVMFRWRDHRGRTEHQTVWSVFPKRTRYFAPTRSRFMINYIVDDLDALLVRLRRARVWIDPRRANEPYGKFAWIRDRDGNRIELWQPM